MTNRPPRLWIKASPRGTRSGFAVLPDGAGGQVTVTVLPKPWSSKTRVVQDYAHSPGSTTHVVVHETELAAISTSAASAGYLAMGLAAAGGQQADLLVLGSASHDPLCTPHNPGDSFGTLIDLMLLAERGGLVDSPLSFEGKFAPALLRLLAHERLLNAVEGLTYRVRPRYAERTETLAMPRGRLREKSLLLSLATRTPRVESTFDELTTNTPLLQIIASALRVVGSDRLPSKIATLRPARQTRSIHLLRLLSGVTLVERQRALLAAERLWVSPLDQSWMPAVDAAVPVLRDWAITPEDDTDRTDAILVHVSTEKFWEQCLELALTTAFRTVAVSRDARAGEGAVVPAPWVPKATGDADPAEKHTKSFPDFMLRSGRQVVVADAKYKLGSYDAPSSSDGYQLFAYSHLASLGGQPSDIAVILYPTQAGGRPGQLELKRTSDRPHPLWLARVPFPTRSDLRSQGAWSAYIANLAAATRDLSTDWTRRSAAFPAVTAIQGVPSALSRTGEPIPHDLADRAPPIHFG